MEDPKSITALDVPVTTDQSPEVDRKTLFWGYVPLSILGSYFRLFLVAIVVISIVAMGHVAQQNTDFQKPYFTVYLNYCFYALTLPVYLILWSIFRFVL